MLIIPEIPTVVLLVRKTGSETLSKVAMKKYPKAFIGDRHGTADRVPEEYSRWPKIGVVREPVARLWSLYRFLQAWPGVADMPFEDWLLNESIARESQWLTLRPDLGTEIYQYTDQPSVYGRLDIRVPPESEWERHDPKAKPHPGLSAAGLKHIVQYFPWDLMATRGH